MKRLGKLFKLLTKFDTIMAAANDHWAMTVRLTELEQKVALTEKKAAEAQAISKELSDFFRKGTEIHADIDHIPRNAKLGCDVIVVGHYGRKDYINTFRVESDDFQSLIEQLRAMSRNGRKGRVDAPPAMKAMFERAWE